MRHKASLYIVIIFGILVSVQTISLAQIRINSPYTRFGVGNIGGNTAPQILAMGGVSTALRPNGFINLSNPASYTAIDSLSFLFDVGIIDQYLDLEVDGSSTTSNYVSLSQLIFGFPVNRWWGSSIGIAPVTEVGYIYKLYTNVEDIGPVEYSYDGSGGINQFYWGNGFRILPNLSLGLNISYLFGSISHNRAAYLPDTALYYNFKITEKTIYKDLYFTFGLQYHKGFKKEKFLDAGLTFNNSANITADYSYLGETFLAAANDIEYVKDTVNETFIDGGKVKFPYRLGVGLTYGQTGKWLVSSDFRWENWEKYSSFGQNDSLQNSYKLSIGGEFRPNSKTMTKYWKSVVYRLGFRYSKSYLQLRNNDLNEFGISFGLGLPLKRSKTTINLGLEAGNRGTTKDDLVKEGFIRFAIGVSVNERWFVKRRYD